MIIHASSPLVHEMINREIVESGIPPEKIIVAGFSQGAVMSLISGLSFPQKLGGIVAMSGYLPIPDKFHQHIHPSNKNTPIVMFHGKEDDVVQYEWGLAAYHKLKDLELDVKMNSFDMMGHSACDEEIMLVREFVKDRTGL